MATSALSPKTAYCYDPQFLEHDLPGHPENRSRLEHALAALEKAGLLARMSRLTPRSVDLDLLGRVHSASYIGALRALAQRGGGHLDADTYVRPCSFEIALLAAGGLVELVRAVLEGQARNGIALVRPPGHHAVSSRGMGFCLFNNIAIAARAALDQFGLDRVLIVDWDVHHGNGTQDIFYDSPQVLFFSTHQYPHYPGTGHWRETGTGAGTGYTVNVPLPAGVGDQGFGRVFDEVLVPLAERYQPQMILVSAGYDAHWNDPLAGLNLSVAGYWHLARTVVGLADRLCQGRVVVTLEGGYNLDVLGAGLAATCHALLGDTDPGPDPLGPSPWAERPVDEVLRAVKSAHGL
ncbi:MAG: histone deacetylase [Anaerolineae bacterium]|nr:histone deacetylase [Anaerolineae bacterium]